MKRLRDRVFVEMNALPEVGARGLTERIGGRWAISVRGFLVAFLIALIGILVDVQRLGDPDGLMLLGATVFVFALNGLIDLLLHYTRWSDRRIRPIPAIEVLSRLVFTGTTFAIVFSLLRTELGIDMPAGVVEGFVLYPALSVWVGSSLIVSLDVIDQARKIRQQSIVERSRATDVIRRADETVDALRERVDETLRPELDRLREVVSLQQHGTVSDEIRQMVDRSVRKVGHELWVTAEGKALRITMREVVRGLLFRPVLRPWSIIGLGIIIPVVGDGSKTTPGSLLVAVIAAVAVLAECWLANTAMRRWPNLGLLVIVMTVGVFTGQTLLVDRLGERYGQSPEDPGVLAVIFLTAALIFVTSAFGLYRDLNDVRAQAIGEAIASDRLDAAAHALAVSEETRRLASLLHGRLQSRLLGCAMAIEFAKDDPVLLRDALDRTLRTLSLDWQEEPPSSPSALDSVIEPWRGLADVRLTVNGVLSDQVNNQVAVVVEELVANAVRHGRATRISVVIGTPSGECVVEVWDNGTSTPSMATGLGSKILERSGVVERVPTESGWNVKVRILLND